MQRIFDEEQRATGPIRPNLRQTGCFRFGSSLKKTNRETSRFLGDVAHFATGRCYETLEVAHTTARFMPCRQQMRHAGTATMNVNRP